MGTRIASICKTRKRTSLDELFAFVSELLRHVVIADELLEAEEGEYATAESEIRRGAQQQDQYREVNVEAVRDERDHVHVTHNLHKPKGIQHDTTWRSNFLFFFVVGQQDTDSSLVCNIVRNEKHLDNGSGSSPGCKLFLLN